MKLTRENRRHFGLLASSSGMRVARAAPTTRKEVKRARAVVLGTSSGQFESPKNVTTRSY